MKWFKANFLQIVILIILAMVLLQRCGGSGDQVKPTVTIDRDTVWSFHDSVVYTKPVVIRSETTPVEKWDTSYLPSPINAELLNQYMRVTTELLKKNYLKDTLKIPGFGYVAVNDTVTKNLVAGRGFTYNLKLTTITETFTITNPPKRQLYIGGGVEGSKADLIQKVKAGLLYKDRRDRIFIVEGGINKKGILSAELKTYWKLKF